MCDFVPANRQQSAPGVVRGQWSHVLPDGLVQCDLCPRRCKLREGERGFCYVREARDGDVVLTSYGRATAYRVEPIEKKPLNHFLAGSSTLSLGTAGCNLGCHYCQNWDTSRARRQDDTTTWLSPEQLSETAVGSDCHSVAFSFNDPIIFAEYAIDCAQWAHARQLKAVAVSDGYITPEARADFYGTMDAVNIDLKAFTEEFYRGRCSAHLDPVLDTLQWLKHDTRVWLEVTTLLIPGHNDSEAEVGRLCAWFAAALGPETPLHFSAFYPAFKMLGVRPTPSSTLKRARRQALAAGLKHVYTGNIIDPEGQSTYCAECNALAIGRSGYTLTAWLLDASGHCPTCGRRLAGHFEPTACG